MRTIIGSSGRDCVLIIDGFFQGNLFWVSHYDILPPNLHIGKRTNQILNNLSKIILRQKTTSIFL